MTDIFMRTPGAGRKDRNQMVATRLRVRPSFWLWAVLFVVSIAAASTATAGSVTGRVVDADTGDPLAFSNVIVVGTERGAITDDSGRFTIDGLDTGTYSIKVSYIGFEDFQKTANVTEGSATTMEFSMVASVVGTLGEVEVTASKEEIIDLKSSGTETKVNAASIESLPVEEITDAIALKAGVVAKGDELFFRGGRSGEVAVMVDGVAVKKPAVGVEALRSETSRSRDAEIILGGMDAKYGNAQSGVINYTTKEGGDHVAGQFRYETDDFGAPDKTFNNYDRVQFSIGGPLPVNNANYFVSAQGSWADSYPATRERRNHDRILDFISVGDRKVNDIRIQSKFTWRPGIPYKLNLELINNRTRQDRYIHNWSWEGYVKTFFDTLETGGDGGTQVELRRGPWSPFQLDETYEYYNAAEHTPDVDNRYNQSKLSFTHTLGEGTFYSVKAARQAFDDRVSVQGKDPWEYEGDALRDLYFDYENSEQSSFFVRGGDYPSWSRRKTKVYSGRADLTHQWNKHTFETGVDFRYNDLFYSEVQQMYLFRDGNSGTIGLSDRYHFYQPEGAFYIQDRWEHEGMVLNIGMRYDAFSVGNQIDPSEVDQGLTQQLSPRVGIAYPISDRDVFSFHYGRYYQFPNRQNLYDNRNVTDNRIRGNPNLTNENTVAYQAAIQHLFSETVKGQFSVYYKDIFGLLSVESVRAQNSANLVNQYVNRDYASSRGFEVSLARAFGGGITGELAYTFGVASGVASDPNAANELNFRYLPISEQPLAWDQRHSFSASFQVADPTGNWNLGGVWSFGTGFPYTPRQRDTRDIEPEVVNSRRLPVG